MSATLAAPKHDADTVLHSVIEWIGRYGRLSMDDLLKLVPANDKALYQAIERGIAEQRFRWADGYVVATAPRESYPSRPECPGCGGRLVAPSEAAEEKRAAYRRACAESPLPTYLLNQRPVTADTSWNRALYMAWRGDLDHRRIVVLGDDDLTSLAIGLLATGSAVTVLEADPRLIRFLQETADRLGIRDFTAVQYDCRAPVPETFRQTFDVALTDPSATLFELFISRCVSLVRPGGESTVYTFANPTNLRQSTAFQDLASRMGLMITDMIPAFNRYALVDTELAEGQERYYAVPGASEERVSFVESLVRLRTSPDAAPSISGALEASATELYGARAAKRLASLDRDPARLRGPDGEWRELMERFGATQ